MSTPRFRDADHVVVVPPCTLVCQHCGDRVVIQPPVAIRSLSAIAQAYSDVHRECPPPPDAEQLKAEFLRAVQGLGD